MRALQLIENIDFRRDWNKVKKTLAATVSLTAPDTHLGDGIYIDLIAISNDLRGQGHGATAMQTLIQIADKHNVTLFLSPEALGQGQNGALEQNDLEKWYRRLGFEPVTNDDWVWARHPT